MGENREDQKNQADPRDKGTPERYDHRNVEPKWEKKWEEVGIYQAVDFAKNPKKYILFEFPYPSGERLHMGHAFTFTGTDVLARFNRMKGFNVLTPMGWDAFGLPAENYAIKTGINPMVTTANNIANSKLQVKKWGISVDWDREIATTDPKYYKWTQWIFLQWYKKGLAYKKEMPINWCPSCKIGLANEEVVAGKCERCGKEVTRRTIKQWVVKITDYADRLIEGLKNTAFIEKVKAAQVNWIGRSEGAEIEFTLKWEVGSEKLDNEMGSGKKESHVTPQFPASHLQPLTSIKVFTTRPDTIYGATFMVISPEHSLAKEILERKIGEIGKIREYVENAKKKSDLERTELNKEKTGVFSGLYAINPATGKEIPIWISDFVLSSYGAGAIMAVPAHDERDFAFAKKFGLPIVPVIIPEGESEKWEVGRPARFALRSKAGGEVRVGSENWDFEKGAYTEVEKGITINSPEWNGMVPSEAIKKAIAWVEEKGIGKKTVSYHLRDWIFSRQHYWGEPIPMIFCEQCSQKIKSEIRNSKSLPEMLRISKQAGETNLSADRQDSNFKFQISNSEMTGWWPVPEDQLPVELPKVEKYQPTDTGESPLAEMEDWVNVKCPRCGGPAKRETDTMPNWAGSDWYYLAYPIADKLKKFEARSTKFETNSKSQIQNSKQKSFENYNLENSNLFGNSDLDIRISQNIFEESKNILGYWLPVDVYVGGDEHNTLHLLYSRFTYQFLYDIGCLPKDIPEPYFKRLSHGVILGADGQRMSKSRGNVINPDEIVEAFGADSLRLYLMFIGPFDYTLSWNQESLEGCYRFLKRVWRLGNEVNKGDKKNKEDKNLERKLNQTIKKVGEDIDNLKFNTAIAGMMELLNEMTNDQCPITKDILEKFLLILAPFAPHITEELWERLGNKFSIHQQSWPEYDASLIEEEIITIAVQVNGKLRGTINVQFPMTNDQKEIEKMAKEDERVKKYLGKQEIKRTIYIPGKLINFVI